MEDFLGTPVHLSSEAEASGQLLRLSCSNIDMAQIEHAIEHDRLVLIQATPFAQATAAFATLVDRYGLRDSYEVQMQFVVHTMKDRTPVEDVAVTVNERGACQIIQPHCEGDSTSQLDLFGLYCVCNATTGGENILSLIEPRADCSRLRAKEKAIVGNALSAKEIATLRGQHLDARTVLASCDDACRLLTESEHGRVIVRRTPVLAAQSAISGETLRTLWDNVTVHDHAFHRHHYELLRHLNILHEGLGSGYAHYMHVEADSSWAPADTDSGDSTEIARLFRCHVLHKMQSGDLLIFHNRAWTHAVNNWPPHEVRQLRAMYA